MSSQFLVILLLTITCISAVQQYLTFYANKQFKGESVTFRTNVGNLESFLDTIITIDGSYEALGWWTCFSRTNYEGDVEIFFGGDVSPKSGGNNETNWDWGVFKSCRHSGASNTDTAGLSLYSKLDLGGTEQFITGPCSVVNFPVRSFVKTGISNWTFYEGSNFNGSNECFTSNGMGISETGVIKSIRIGCEVKTDGQ